MAKKAMFVERYYGAAGLVPLFLNPNDARPAKEQINTAYAHGGGWQKFEGFNLQLDWDKPKKSSLEYEGDSPMFAKAYCQFGEELIIIFDCDWCAIVQPDMTYEVARLD